jgi:hypothetical protein
MYWPRRWAAMFRATFGFATGAGPLARRARPFANGKARFGQWYSPLKSNRMLQEVIVPDIPRQTWTERAIADDMVTTFDPATGAVSGIDQIRPAFVKVG